MTLSMSEKEAGVALSNLVCEGKDEVKNSDVDGQDSGREIWVADTGATHHATSCMDQIFNYRPAPKGKDRSIVGNGDTNTVRAVGSLNLRFHTRGADGKENSSTAST